MRSTVTCVALLAALSLVWADPAWPREAVAREGQSLLYEGASGREPGGGVVLAWAQSRQGENCLLVNKLGPAGQALWPEPVLVKGGQDIKSGVKLAGTADGGHFLSWLEDTHPGRQRLRAQKLGADGALLWNQEGVLVCEAFYSTPEWLVAPNPEGGACLFVNAYPGYGNTSQAFGCNLNAQGSDVWGANPPTITHNGYTVLNSLLATPGHNGLLLLYRILESQGVTNVFRHYSPEGVNDWELYCQPQPGEFGEHQLLPAGPDKVLDLALAAEADTRINIRALSLNTGQWIPEEASALVVNPLPAASDSRFQALLRPDTGTLAILSATRQNEVSVLREFLLDEGLAPTLNRHIFSTADAVDDLGQSADERGTLHCAWTEQAGYGSARVLKAQLLNLANGALIWPVGGLTLSPALEERSGAGILATEAGLLAIFAETGSETTSLKRRAFNRAGDPLLTPPQEICATVWNGHAWPSSCLKVGNHSVIIHSDSRSSTDQRYYYQQLDAWGQLELEPGGRLICSGDAMTTFVDARPLGDTGFTVIYKNDGLYLQNHDLSGHALFPGGGILLGLPASNRARMAVCEGDIYVVWTEQDNGVYRVKGQRISGGELMWGTAGVVLADDLSQAPRDLGAPEGRYFTWAVRSQPGTYQIRGKRLDANGLELPGWSSGSNLIFSTSELNDLLVADVALSGADLLIFAGSFALENFYAQRVNSGGELPWGEAGRLIHAAPHMYMGCLAEASGVSVGYGFYANGNRGAYLQTVDPGGNLLYPEPGLLLDGNDLLAAGSMDLGRFADGGLLVAWSGNYNPDYDDNLDLWYRRLEPGEQTGGKPLLLAGGPFRQNAPLIAGSGENELTLCWADARAGGSSVQPLWGIYAQQFSGGGSPTPPEPDLPGALVVKACYPNPFNRSVQISWSQPRNLPAHCSVYNVRGQLLKRFPAAEARAGEHQLVWNGDDDQGRDVGSGIHLIRLQCGSEIRTRKVLRL